MVVGFVGSRLTPVTRAVPLAQAVTKSENKNVPINVLADDRDGCEFIGGPISKMLTLWRRSGSNYGLLTTKLLTLVVGKEKGCHWLKL